MEPRYQALRTLYDIVKNDPQPTTYPCRPREIILRLMLDWNIIADYLHELKEENFVVTKQLDTLVINITAAGIEKAVALTREKKMI
ncbi:MAG: hypothetical protein WDO16_04100 [Bacteroidota bacterium]